MTTRPPFGGRGVRGLLPEIIMHFIGNPLHIGDDASTGAPVVLTPDQLSTHVGVFGRSGQGKSKLLEHLVRQVVRQWPVTRSGCLVLDPHGPVYDGLLSYAAHLNVRRPIVPIDLRDPGWVVAYNLLRPRGAAKAAVVVDSVVEAMLHAWGAADADATPLLARWSGNLFHALHEMRATLADAMHLIASPATRRRVAQRLGEHFAARDWHLAADLREPDFEAMVSSTVNRLRRFLGNDTLRLMLGQSGPSLDFGQALEAGWIVLVCLATEDANVSRENSDLIGSLMLSDLWTSAAVRGKRDKLRQFLVVADEFQRYLSPAIADGLDQSRGMGLAWVLACQFPHQVKFKGGAQGDHLLASLMENVGSKLTFNLSDEPNVRPLASWMSYGTFDPYRVKHVTESTKVMGHVEVEREIVTNTSSTTETDTTQTTIQRGTNEGTADAWEDELDLGGRVVGGDYAPAGRNSGSSTIEGESTGSSIGKTTGRSVGKSYHLLPVMGTEVSGTEFKSLDEQHAEASQAIVRLPKRTAIFRGTDMTAPVTIRVPDVIEGAGKYYTGRYARRSAAQFPFVWPTHVAAEHLRQRQRALMDLLNNNVDTDDGDPSTGRRVDKRPPRA